MKNPRGIATTIVETPNGQLLVTVPKGLAKLGGIEEGDKVNWLLEKRQAIGRVMI